MTTKAHTGRSTCTHVCTTTLAHSHTAPVPADLISVSHFTSSERQPTLRCGVRSQCHFLPGQSFINCLNPLIFSACKSILPPSPCPCQDQISLCCGRHFGGIAVAFVSEECYIHSPFSEWLQKWGPGWAPAPCYQQPLTSRVLATSFILPVSQEKNIKRLKKKKVELGALTLCQPKGAYPRLFLLHDRYFGSKSQNNH